MGVLFNITGGPSLTLFECNEAAQVISNAVDPDANIVFGVVFDPKMDSEVRITVIATGFAKQQGRGIYSADELRRLIRGSSDALDVPSFLRRAQHFPASHLESGSKTPAPVTPEPTKISRQ